MHLFFTLHSIWNFRCLSDIRSAFLCGNSVSCYSCNIQSQTHSTVKVGTFENIKYNHQPKTTTIHTTKPHPAVQQPYTSRDSDSTTCLGSLLQWVTTLSISFFLLMSKLNLPWCDLKPFPLLLSLVTQEKRLSPTPLQPPFRWLQRLLRSPQRLLFSRLNSHSPLSGSSQELCSRPFTRNRYSM